MQPYRPLRFAHSSALLRASLSCVARYVTPDAHAWNSIIGSLFAGRPNRHSFAVFRVPVMNLIHGLMAGVMLSRASCFRGPERRADYAGIFATLAFTIAIKANFEALEAEFDSLEAGLLSEEERALLEFSLATNPAAHPVISGTDGVRKARWTRAESGKRGGIRVIYFYAISAEVILLLSVYAKNQKETLSNDDKKNIRRLVEAFKRGLAP